jgi:hypothetical protein
MIVGLLAVTGMRVGDVVSLDDDVDGDGQRDPSQRAA